MTNTLTPPADSTGGEPVNLGADQACGSLQAVGVSRRYGNTLALDGVSVTIHPGEVHALMGHNGAGKSTLLRQLAGAERPDSGSILLNGHEVVFSGPRQAHSAGVIGVYQELALAGNLTVAENLFLGHEAVKGGFLVRSQMRREAQEVLERYQILAKPDDILGDLPVASRQLIEVASALRRQVRFLLLDEPTTALSLDQVEGLLERIREISAQDGVGVVVVDHRLDEVYAVADRITAMVDGKLALTGPVQEVPRARLEDVIVGSEVAHDASSVRSVAMPAVASKRPPTVQAAAARLSVQHLRTNRLQDVSFEVQPGEILGLYGLVGSGRTRALRTLFGLEPIIDGSVQIDNQPYHPKSPAAAMRAGIAYLSEERKQDGFQPDLSAMRNVTIPVLRDFEKVGLISYRRADSVAARSLAALHVRGDTTTPMKTLSGGNQQKVLLARAILQEPQILLLDEPTKGIDIGTKAEILGMIKSLADERGIAVVVVSTDEEELLAFADRIVVVSDGSTIGESVDSATTSVSDLRRLALRRVA